MNIFYQDNVLLRDIPVTASAEHEEELMKSDLVKLSWSDTEKVTIPVDAFIIPFDDNVPYFLMEPYEPEQKSNNDFKYEPKFQHPKMYLGKVTFKRPSKDSDANDITLLDWSYVGEIYTLLEYFCEQMNNAFGFTGHDAFGYEVIGELNDNMATISFSTQDILSALSNVANALDCEWHIDWQQRTLYFGRILFLRSSTPRELIVGNNITVPSVRNSKEGFWNAFESQGSTRNITRRAASGEYVTANVRLSLRNYEGNKYPDGIVYTDGEGHIISKSAFEQRGTRAYIKSLIFEDIFPKLDLYVYNVRYRERYLLEDLDDPNTKVIDHYDSNNNPVYKRYAVWYMNLAYPEYDVDGNVTAWHDFDIDDIRQTSFGIVTINSNDLTNYYVSVELNVVVNTSFFTNESKSSPGSYIVHVSLNNIEIKGYVYFPDTSSDTNCMFYAHYSDGTRDDRDETDLAKMTAFQAALNENSTITFVDGIKRTKFPTEYSQIIDGKSLYGQFKVNTHEDAETSPLAGRGNGDNGNYGFGIIYLGIEGQDYINEANLEPSEDGDTGIIDMDGNRATVSGKDYEIVFQQSDDYILPTIKDQLIIPKGSRNGDVYIKNLDTLSDKNIGLRGNIVNFYNIVMDSSYEDSAKRDLENATKKYITNSLEDNNSYSFKSDPFIFSDQFHTPLYIGEKVQYIDGNTYTSNNPLLTRVMKLVTKLDYAFEQEITIGNEVLKGNQQSLKEQVQMLSSVGAASGSGSGSGTGGISLAALRQLLKSEGVDLFLSKVYNDEAQGVIGFLKGAWFGVKQWFIDRSGNANFNDTTVNGLLKAYNAMINNVRSTNYTGDGMMDSGWRITNEYEGSNSKATFDFLYIRKKAIFEELEIRKLSHIGGNFCLSGASGRVWKVDYFDSEGNVLGYDTYTVPWTLASRLMILFTRNPNNRYLGRRKQLQRKLTDAERLRVAKVRCYMYTDDGSTETMSNWTVGAQARCQTFNIEKQMEFDGSSWKGEKVGNTYWYRLVTGVGNKTLEDGKKHDYVEFSVDMSQEGTAYAWADAGSDLPSKGDVFVQMGHRTRADQSNVIMLETANDDSPAIKMYAGVNWWTYDNKLVAVMSPNGWRIVSNKFEWITQYGERFQTTVNRGVWIEITPDEQGKRKCYYNDMVSHNGAYWRCIVSQDSYTTDEPSESSSAWSKEVYAGIAPYVKLSEALVAVPCEKNSVASAAFSKTIVPKLMLTNLECTLTSVTLEGADSNVYKSGNNIVVNFASGASVTNKDYTVTLEGTYDGNSYVASDKLSVYAVVRGNDGYEVMCEPNTMIFTQQKESPYSINLDGSETGNSSTQISVKMDGASQPFRITSVVCTGKNGAGQAVQGITATYSNVSGRAWITHIPNNVEKGEMAITVSYGSNAQHTIILQFYCNLIGTWQEQVVGDTKTEIATKTAFEICDETGAVVGTTTLANFTKSSSKEEATLKKTTTSQGQSITAINEWQRTADGNFVNINNGLNDRYTKSETATYVSQQLSSATQGMVTTSNFEQTASSFSLITETRATTIAEGKAASAENDVISRLSKTGIKIDGNNRAINLYGDKVKFYNSSGGEANIKFDTDSGIYIFNGWLVGHEGANIYGGDISLYASNTNGDASIKANRNVSVEAEKNITIGRTNGTENITLNCTSKVSVNQDADFSKAVSIGGNTTVGGNLTVSGDFTRKVTINSVPYTVPAGERLYRKLSGNIDAKDEVVFASGNVTLPSVSSNKHITVINGLNDSIRIYGNGINGAAGNKYVNVDRHEVVECYYYEYGSSWVIAYAQRSEPH